MVNLCCICKLEAGIIADVSFHRIPKQEEIKLKWFISIGREVKKYATVCSKHFVQEDFYYKEINHVMKRFLLPTAVPSLLLIHSNNSDNECRKSCQTVLSESNINKIHVKNNNNDCIQPSGSSNVLCNTIKNEVVQCLTVENPDVTSTILHTSESTKSAICSTDNNLLHIPKTENCSNLEIAKNEIGANNNSDLNKHIEESELNDLIEFSTNSTKNTQKSTLKRKKNEPNINVKHFYNPRYIGDLRRQDFTSDASWRIVNTFVIESRAKQKFLNQKVNRLHKKVKSLQALLNYLKQNRLLSNSARNAVQGS